MGFMDKARSQLDNLASKADSALGGAGNDVERHYRDLGVLAYLEATGRPADAGERERVLGALRAMEQRGAIRSTQCPATASATRRSACGELTPSMDARARRADSSGKVSAPDQRAPCGIFRLPVSPGPPRRPPPPPFWA